MEYVRDESKAEDRISMLIFIFVTIRSIFFFDDDDIFGQKGSTMTIFVDPSECQRQKKCSAYKR